MSGFGRTWASVGPNAVEVALETAKLAWVLRAFAFSPPICGSAGATSGHIGLATCLFDLLFCRPIFRLVFQRGRRQRPVLSAGVAGDLIILPIPGRSLLPTRTLAFFYPWVAVQFSAVWGFCPVSDFRPISARVRDSMRCHSRSRVIHRNLEAVLMWRRPNSADFAPVWPTLGRCLPEFGPSFAGFGQLGPRVDKLVPNLAKFRRCRQDCGPHWPLLGHVGTRFVRCGKAQTDAPSYTHGGHPGSSAPVFRDIQMYHRIDGPVWTDVGGRETTSGRRLMGSAWPEAASQSSRVEEHGCPRDVLSAAMPSDKVRGRLAGRLGTSKFGPHPA